MNIEHLKLEIMFLNRNVRLYSLSLDNHPYNQTDKDLHIAEEDNNKSDEQLLKSFK